MANPDDGPYPRRTKIAFWLGAACSAVVVGLLMLL